MTFTNTKKKCIHDTYCWNGGVTGYCDKCPFYSINKKDYKPPPT